MKEVFRTVSVSKQSFLYGAYFVFCTLMNRLFTAVALLLLLTVGFHIFSGLLFSGGMVIAKKRAVEAGSFIAGEDFHIVTLSHVAYHQLSIEKLDEGVLETEINGRKADIYKVIATSGGYQLYLKYDNLETELLSFVKTSVDGMLQGKWTKAFTFFGFYFQQYERIIYPQVNTASAPLAWAYQLCCGEPHLWAFSPPPEHA
jgi:hypothetical protein